MHQEPELTPIGQGAGVLGNLYKVVSDGAARETLSAAWDSGIRYFDTAPFYGMGLSERRVGDALRGLDRDSFALSTKVGRRLEPIPAGKSQFGFETPMPFTPTYDYGYDGVWRSWEASLHRLGLSRVDILYMHDIGELTHGREHPQQMRAAEGGFRALTEMREQGLIRQFGIGVNEVDVCHQVLECADIDVILLAGQYNLLQHNAADALFGECAQRDVSIIAAGVYASGILATGTYGDSRPYYDYEPAPPEIIAKVQKIEAVCAEFGVGLPTAALQFVQRHSAVRSVLLGMTGRHRVEQNVASSKVEIPGDFWSELKSRGLLSIDVATGS